MFNASWEGTSCTDRLSFLENEEGVAGKQGERQIESRPTSTESSVSESAAVAIIRGSVELQPPSGTCTNESRHGPSTGDIIIDILQENIVIVIKH